MLLGPSAVGGGRDRCVLLDPLVDALEARGVPRARAIICVFSLAFVITGAVIGSVLPRIINETRDLVDRIPGYMTRMQRRAEFWINNPPALRPLAQ